MTYRKSVPLAFLLASTLLITNNGESNEADNELAYKKVSPDATIKYRLQSNMERTHFLVDDVDVGTGRKITALVNNQGHKIVAKPENCEKPKEEYVQPPYTYEAPLSFTFVSGDCEREAVIAGAPDTNYADGSQISPEVVETIFAMKSLCLVGSESTIEASGEGNILILKKGAKVEGRYTKTEIPALLAKLQSEASLSSEAKEVRQCMDAAKKPILEWILHQK